MENWVVSTLDLRDREGVLAVGTGTAGKAGLASNRLDARAGANGVGNAPDVAGSALNKTGCRVAAVM